MTIEIYLSDKRFCRDSESEKIEFNELISMAMSRKVMKYLFRYDSLIIHSKSYNALPSPFLAICICRMLCKGKAEWHNEKGEIRKIGIGLLLNLLASYIKEHMTYKAVIKEIEAEVDKLQEMKKDSTSLFIQKKPLFLRLDLTFGIVAGGSVGHTAGVVNNLEKFSGSPILVSSDYIPTVKKDIDTILIDVEVPYRNVIGVAALMYNLVSYPIIENLVQHNDISFIYQRSSLDIYSGAKLAICNHIPYVLEYNSGVWAYMHWGGKNSLKYIELAQKIENLTFKYADLITCVSKPLKQELIDKGVDENKIIVTPNGVDPDIFTPDIDGQVIRKKYSIESNTVVIGFIGTFGKWHGAEILTEAYAKLRETNKHIHLLMMGDGVKMEEVKHIIYSNHIENFVTLTGMVPQKEASIYLAACDILVSPTLQNPDGTPFFGSPTKLFEYMAMGKGIIASNIGQMTEVLKDGETAILVEPNSVPAVKDGIEKLIMDKELRVLLGKNARKEVCSKYTWEMHTEKIVMALRTKMEAENSENKV